MALLTKAMSLFARPCLTELALRKTCEKFSIGAYRDRVAIGAVTRPHYGYCVFNSAMLAKWLGYPRISVLEFGVAGGNGLVALEYHARETSRALGIDVDVYGFDTGGGLPAPVDYRDLPYHWKPGFFEMDQEKLKARLQKATLVLGDVAQTVPSFVKQYDPAPIGAVMHDLDLYSSTAHALKLFDEADVRFIPRVFCYFDDVVGSEIELYSEYTGELLAMREFNDQHEKIKLATAAYLLAKPLVRPWYHQIRIAHFFNHPKYNAFVSDEAQQLKLK